MTPVSTLHISPICGEALQREITREQAAIALRSMGASIVLILACAASGSLACWMLWTQLSKYDQLLKYCAGV